MAKHIKSLQLTRKDTESSAVPLSIIRLPSASPNSSTQPTVMRTGNGQTIQMIQVGNGIFQVTTAHEDDASEGTVAKKGQRKPRKSCVQNTSNGHTIAFIKSEKDELNNSYSSHNEDEDDDSNHLDEDSSEHPDGGLLNLAMATSSSESSSAAGTTLVQGPDGRLFIPVPVLSSNMGSLPRGMVQTNESGSMGSPVIGEEITMKRELRLLKNREAARECRRKKKEYVRCLENRVALLENQNKTLISELKSLKELYCQKEPHS